MKRSWIACSCLMIATSAFAGDGEMFCDPCLNKDGSLSPTGGFTTVSGNTCGQPNNEYAYSFCCVAGDTFIFSLCPGDGGSATYDSALSIQGPGGCGSIQACNDDFCGPQSYLTWVCPATDHFILSIDGFSSSDCGSYTLAYMGPPCAVPIEPASWGTIKAFYGD